MTRASGRTNQLHLKSTRPGPGSVSRLSRPQVAMAMAGCVLLTKRNSCCSLPPSTPARWAAPHDTAGTADGDYLLGADSPHDTPGANSEVVDAAIARRKSKPAARKAAANLP